MKRDTIPILRQEWISNIMEKIRVVCPNCGKVLKLDNNPAYRDKLIKCPTCGVANPFTLFKPFVQPAKTGKNEEEDTTQIVKRHDDTSGYFMDDKTSLKYFIPDGEKSLFGRMTLQSPSKADVPIDVYYSEGLDKGISRSHFWIQSVLSADGQYHVYISNAKNVNRTYINGVVLDDGDVVGLKDGDTVSCSNMVLRYVKPSASDSASSVPGDREDDEEVTAL